LRLHTPGSPQRTGARRSCAHRDVGRALMVLVLTLGSATAVSNDGDIADNGHWDGSWLSWAKSMVTGSRRQADSAAGDGKAGNETAPIVPYISG